VWATGRAGLLRAGARVICALLSLMSGPTLREAAASLGPMVILVLGDSLTAGLGVPREAAFPGPARSTVASTGDNGEGCRQRDIG
jgi:hypothetical protein